MPQNAENLLSFITASQTLKIKGTKFIPINLLKNLCMGI